MLSGWQTLVGSRPSKYHSTTQHGTPFSAPLTAMLEPSYHFRLLGSKKGQTHHHSMAMLTLVYIDKSVSNLIPFNVVSTPSFPIVPHNIYKNQISIATFSQEFVLNNTSHSTQSLLGSLSSHRNPDFQHERLKSLH